MLARCLPAVVFCALSVSCAGLERADDCRAVARVINPALAEIAHDRTTLKGATYRGISTKYEALAVTAGQVKLRSKHIAEAVNDYQRMLHEAARDARSFADALDAHDEARIAISRTNATRTLRHEATSLARFDNVCRGR